MAVDPNEQARFKSALAKLSLEEIQRRLDRNLIVRSSERDLAEGEGERRRQEERAREEKSKLDRRLRQRINSRRVWGLVGIAILAVVILIWNISAR